MTTYPQIVDAENVVGDYLRNHPEVAALTDNVVGQSFGDSQGPWVVVTQLDVTDRGESLEHLTEHMLQFDIYAGKEATTEHRAQAEVNDLARTVRAALKDLQDQTVSDVVVNRVVFSGMLRMPDDTFEPARQRIALTADIVLHS